MPPFLRYFITRLLLVPVSLVVVTATLFAMLMVVPPQLRALLYLPAKQRANAIWMSLDDLRGMTEKYIQR